PLLRRVGLTPEVIADPEERLSVRSQVALLDDAAIALKDDSLGFTLARDFDPRELELLYYVMASSQPANTLVKNRCHNEMPRPGDNNRKTNQWKSEPNPPSPRWSIVTRPTRWPTSRDQIAVLKTRETKLRDALLNAERSDRIGEDWIAQITQRK